MRRGAAAGSPRHRPAAPLLPWTLFLLWNSLCALAVVRYLPLLTEPAHELLFACYQPLVPLIAMLWLWGLNVGHFEGAGVKYEALFGPEEQRYLLRRGEIHELAGAATSLAMTGAAAFVVAAQREDESLAAWMPKATYCMLIALALFPTGSLHGASRHFFCHTFRRILLPFQSVTFSDFILADILTSVAKALADLQRAVCLSALGFSMPRLPTAGHSLSETCSRGAWPVGAVLALPYFLRFCQCLIVYASTRESPNLLNAIKYFSAFPVIGLSMMKYHISYESWTSFWWYMWFLASAVNTMYSYYWDIEMDWDISWFRDGKGWPWPARKPVLKSDLLYSPIWLYYWAMASNLFGRMAWIYKLSSHLKHSRAITFSVALVEVFRRFQWVFLRVECGLRKLQTPKWLESQDPGASHLR